MMRRQIERIKVMIVILKSSGPPTDTKPMVENSSVILSIVLVTGCILLNLLTTARQCDINLFTG